MFLEWFRLKYLNGEYPSYLVEPFTFPEDPRASPVMTPVGQLVS